MTIALGLLCQGGAIVAADTQVTDQSGSTTHAPKVTQFSGPDSVYAIANASNDAFAAMTMINEIKAVLESRAFKSWSEIEGVLKSKMGNYTQQHQLIMAASVARLGIGLYFCEPPRTVVSRLTQQYISAGAGFAVVDPLHHMLFRFTAHFSPQIVFRKVAYLMYRAKRDLASMCGGDTTAFYICEDLRPPEMARIADMRFAETLSSEVDEILDLAAKTAIGFHYETLEKDSKALIDSVSQSKSLKVKFKNSKLELIEAPKPQ